MATRTDRLQERTSELNPDEIEGIHFLTPKEGRELFDREARRLFGIFGEEFLRRWDSGEYGPIADTPEGRKLGRMYTLMGFVRCFPV